MITNKKIGILGGGQLAQMTAHAASKLGIETVIYSEEVNPCSRNHVKSVITAQYTNTKILDVFASQCDIITLETENIPAETLVYMEKTYPEKMSFPRSFVEISQNRIKEKEFAKSLGIDIGQYWVVQNREDIALIVKQEGACILKTVTQGYDGKGQYVIKSLEEIPNITYDREYILEKFIPFVFEISTICTTNGTITEFFPVSQNIHKDGILRESIVPLSHNDYSNDFLINVMIKAQEFTKLIAKSTKYRGTFAVEYFVLDNGDIVFNEIAPRPHNSGHFSLDLCNISQFENHVRAICSLPILKPELLFQGKMVNIIGYDIETLHKILDNNLARIHLYGKSVAAGRKLGHYNLFIK